MYEYEMRNMQAQPLVGGGGMQPQFVQAGRVVQAVPRPGAGPAGGAAPSQWQGTTVASASSMRHSRVVQLDIDDMSKAVSLFGSNTPEGDTPIVLVPAKRMKCSLWVQVPSGVSCLLQKSGVDAGIAAPGLQFMPYYNRIAFIVTRQSCAYDAPVKSCPTSDNVMVSVDVTIIFAIVDPTKFVYNLGAARFDELLSGAVEEGIRGLVRNTSHDQVYTLRGNRAGSMLELLNQKFALTGVTFQDCKITAVWLPPSLAESLESTTKIKSQMATESKESEYRVLERRQKADMAVQEIQRKNEQLLVAENGKKRMAQIEAEQETMKAEEKRRVAVAKAEEHAQTLTMEAEADLRRVRIEVDKQKMEALNKAKKDAQDIVLSSDLHYRQNVADSLNALADAKGKAEQIKLVSEVEKKNAKQLEKQRSHELAMLRRDVLGSFAAKGDFNLVGPSGDAAIQALMKGDLPDSKSKDGCPQM
eukprot:TRINITY_DN90667_c0_g1_i1.p1 TRINITY_DN90667_c0_g1~~TRINITY_DN90667_c0_g1_i1.p1  ORF type:complete len:497 (-),score=142.65 TRINITY_DN90667_c0_g1_i1:330-1748(-)